jgi:hypothetical protein
VRSADHHNGALQLLRAQRDINSSSHALLHVTGVTLPRQMFQDHPNGGPVISDPASLPAPGAIVPAWYALPDLPDYLAEQLVRPPPKMGPALKKGSRKAKAVPVQPAQPTGRQAGLAATWAVQQQHDSTRGRAVPGDAESPHNPQHAAAAAHDASSPARPQRRSKAPNNKRRQHQQALADLSDLNEAGSDGGSVGAPAAHAVSPATDAPGRARSPSVHSRDDSLPTLPDAERLPGRGVKGGPAQRAAAEHARETGASLGAAASSDAGGVARGLRDAGEGSEASVGRENDPAGTDCGVSSKAQAAARAKRPLETHAQGRNMRLRLRDEAEAL